MRIENERIVESAIDVRGSSLRRPVLAVLIVSTMVVIVAFALTYLSVV